MKNDIDKKGFGNLKACVRLVAYEKRGLSHAYCIFFLTLESKANVFQSSFEDIIIFAEISSTGNLLLQQVVLKHDIHNLSKHYNYSEVEMLVGICTKRFSKQFVERNGREES